MRAMNRKFSLAGYEYDLISALPPDFHSKYVVQTWFEMGPRLVNGKKKWRSDVD